jgi:hypothetical protein
MPGKPERSKKTAGGKSAKAKSGKEELLSLLAKTAKGLDEEDLEFLLNQAHVLSYNEQVDRLDERLRRAKSTVREAKKKGSSGRSGPPGRGAPSTGTAGLGEVEIVEKEESGNFFIVVNNFRILFTRDEMRSLVKICQASADGRDASSRLFTWFEKNRKDLLIDGGIVSRTHPALESVYEILIRRYRVKGSG